MHEFVTNSLPSWVPGVLTLAILAGAVYGFVRERVPPDLTSLLALLALLLTGVLTPADAFSGFSHPATVSVAAMLVLSAGLDRTGVLTYLARRLLVPVGRSEFLLAALLMLVVGAISPFINNTAVVAVFIPIVLEVCRRTGASPGRLLMPMAHAARLGGMCTLIGTSINLAAHEYARSQGLPGFGMFELGRVGLPMFAIGGLYILFIGRWFLPRQRSGIESLPDRAGPYISELVVLEGSPWLQRETRAEHLKRDYDVELIEVVREERSLGPEGPSGRYQPGDHVRVRGAIERVLAFAAREGLQLHRPDAWQPAAAAKDSAAPEPAKAAEGKPAPPPPIAEFVVLPGSPLVGRTLKGAMFAERFDALVLALHRPGEHIWERPTTTPLRTGDVLVVEGTYAVLRRLSRAPGFLLVGALRAPDERPHKVGIALLTLLGVIALVTTGLLPIVTAASAGCAVLMLTGCLSPREAYQAIDWSVVFLLAGALALGLAIEKTGVAAQVGLLLTRITGVSGPFALILAFFLAAIVVSEFMSNSGTVLLLGPVAVASAQQLGVNGMALMAAVTLGASASFAMPIGYQTSLMIYGPGGYSLKDFLRMGLVLDLLLTVIGLILIPRYWPLAVP